MRCFKIDVNKNLKKKVMTTKYYTGMQMWHESLKYIIGSMLQARFSQTE